MKSATSFTSSQKYVDLFLILLLDFTSTVTIAFFDSSSVLFPVKRMMATSSYELIQMEDKKYYLLNITSFLIIFYTFIILGHTGRLPSFFLSKKSQKNPYTIVTVVKSSQHKNWSKRNFVYWYHIPYFLIYFLWILFFFEFGKCRKLE